MHLLAPIAEAKLKKKLKLLGKKKNDGRRPFAEKNCAESPTCEKPKSGYGVLEKNINFLLMMRKIIFFLENSILTKSFPILHTYVELVELR